MIANESKVTGVRSSRTHQAIVKGLVLIVGSLNIFGLFLLLNPQPFDTGFGADIGIQQLE